MIHLSTTQKFDPLLLINLENIKVGQISFLNVATFKSAQVPWTYFFVLTVPFGVASIFSDNWLGWTCVAYIFAGHLTASANLVYLLFMTIDR